jgi:replicative superfamily II helicase
VEQPIKSVVSSQIWLFKKGSPYGVEVQEKTNDLDRTNELLHTAVRLDTLEKTDKFYLSMCTGSGSQPIDQN